MGQSGPPGPSEVQEGNAQAVEQEAVDRYPGKNIGTLPTCVEMGSGKPEAQLKLNLSRDFTGMLVKTGRLKKEFSPSPPHPDQ